MATGRPNGRPPKPLEVKRNLGNPGKRELPQVPKPSSNKRLEAVSSIPKPPRDLGKKGKLMWTTVWEAGQQTKHIAPLHDAQLILMLCYAVDEAEFLRTELASGNVDRVYLMSNGAYAPHPYVKELANLRTQITAWLSMLGFSPTDRSRLGIGEVVEDSPLDELEKRRLNRSQGDNNGSN
jgi:P27 family predicted phage terminase small subunit